MDAMTWGLVIGAMIGFTVGVCLGVGALCCLRFRRRCTRLQRRSSQQSAAAAAAVEAVTVPEPVSGNAVVEPSSTAAWDSNLGQDSARTSEWSNMTLWLEGLRRKSVVSACGIPKYSYRDIQSATNNFTTTIGQGAFGPVYKAQMPTGDTFAVKVLAANSRQGQNEFLAEVLLLGRLHHKNLVNLVGYIAEMGQHMLLYKYMSNGCLASHLHGDHMPLSWDLRIDIALDIARGLEYLHYGATPPVVHRDIKSSNILLDPSMRARVSDFGLSRQDHTKSNSSKIRGTFGYLDPEYVYTKIFTKKSDVYSFGVLLFELLTGRNPQQGLMEYVELAAMDTEGKLGWEEIVDSRLEGKFNVQELASVADLAYKCVNDVSKKRPSMRDTVQTLSWILMMRRSPENSKHTSTVAAEETYIEIDLVENQDSLIER